MPHLTDQQEKEYVQRNAEGENHCPACKGTSVTGDGVDIEADRAYQPVRCDACDASWVDVYQLVGILLREVER